MSVLGEILSEKKKGTLQHKCYISQATIGSYCQLLSVSRNIQQGHIFEDTENIHV